MFSALFNIIGLWLIQRVVCESRVDPLVDTKVGLIRGLRASDGDYSMFMGIPYATVNKNNVFGAAAPYSKFKDTFDAFDDTAVCPQAHPLTGSIIGSINCLNLNIYVPNSATTNNRLPVMVWIYGGGFRHGFAERVLYGPQYLVKHDVIVVTINYRVNAYGFMCLDIPEVPGNQGLKDQVLAFLWIKDNISAFGGDPDKITLFGQSAGGHSIELNLMSSSKKLYNKVILQSGSAVASTVFQDPDKSAPLKLALYLGFKTNDTKNALTFLSNSDTNLVVAASIDLKMVFKPCAEKKFNGVESFITKNWVNTDVPKVKGVPVLLGFNEHEMGYTDMTRDKNEFKNLDLVTDHLKLLFKSDNDDLFAEMRNEISHYYFGEEKMDESLKWKIMEYDSDATYIDPVHRTLRNFLKSGADKIFLYMFSYIGGRNKIVIEKDNSPVCCASHEDEMSYLWNMTYKPEPTDLDKLTIDRMTTMWTNFAKYSDPTPEISELLPVKWIPLTNDSYIFLSINRELSLGRRPLNRRMVFWELFYKVYGKYQKYYEYIKH